MADGNILSDFGINILEEEIDDVIFQTNEFLTDATFTGSQGPFWWLVQYCSFLRLQSTVIQQIAILCSVIQISNGTKTGQNHRKIKSRPLLTVMRLRAASPCHLQRYKFVPSKTTVFPYFPYIQSHFLFPMIQRITQVPYYTQVCPFFKEVVLNNVLYNGISDCTMGKMNVCTVGISDLYRHIRIVNRQIGLSKYSHPAKEDDRQPFVQTDKQH